ncbi:hypothetical protein SB48_HM08orf00832 [Heyndrickxia coagulans]|uniref:Uncharacterized protein n=3 Tax=Heyndrickxia TaxID=2837504 RepID=A0AAN0T3R8_HEYCO|nr:hypothetical protein SB48_HM08orf00832 [Heyndrickxia coagulans]
MESGGEKMEKEIWKKIFSTIPDDELANLIRIWKISIRGFRHITSKDITRIRALVTRECLKESNLKKIQDFYKIVAAKDEDDVRDKTVHELFKLYQDGKTLHLILGALYSSPEDRHHERAKQFEELVCKKNGLSSLDELRVLTEKTEPPKQEDEHDSAHWQKKWQKSQKKNQELQKSIKKCELLLSHLKKDWKAEKQSWKKEKEQLQQELGNERTQKNRLNEWKKTSEAEMQRLKDEIQKLKLEISHLNALLLNTNKEVAAAVQTDERVESKPSESTAAARQIYIIGDPKNKLIDESENPLFHTIEANKFKEAVQTGELEDADEIWMMAYLVPPWLKKKIKNVYTQKVREFKDFPSVKKYIERGIK